jgi:hypothetical protein
VRTPSRFKGSLPKLEPVCGPSPTATPSRLGVPKQNCRSALAADRVIGQRVRVASDEDWFAVVGFDVSYEDADGWAWAALHRHGNPQSVVPRFGRGASQQEALASARVGTRSRRSGPTTREGPTTRFCSQRQNCRSALAERARIGQSVRVASSRKWVCFVFFAMVPLAACSHGKSSTARPTHFVCHVSSGGNSDTLSVDLAHASSAQTALFVSSVFRGRSIGFDYLVRFTVRGSVGHRRALVAVSLATDEHTRARSVEGRFPLAGSILPPAQYSSLTPVAYNCQPQRQPRQSA